MSLAEEKNISFIQKRQYQRYVLSVIKQLHDSPQRPSVLVELDCGMGKRILSYLIVKESFPDEKILLLLHSTSSLWETRDYFVNKYQLKDVGVLGSRTPSRLREKILRDFRIILATPQTFANVIKKHPADDFHIKIILINEIDKIVRRTATRRTLIHPYPQILKQLRSAWIVGFSATLRDSHFFVTDRVVLRREIQTLADTLPRMRVLTMEEIMRSDPNFKKHVNETVIQGVPIRDEHVQRLLNYLDKMIKDTRDEIISLAREEGIISPNQKNLAIIAGQIPVDQDLRDRYNSLLMIRKYVTAMMPYKFKPHLKRIPGLPNELVESIPSKSSKLQALPMLLEEGGKKAIIMVSYVHSGEIIQKYLESAGYETFFISGQVKNKTTVIDAFKLSKNEKSVLIMTQVGERDLDIPEAGLIIVFDTINTTKTMYQKFKRSRGGKVLCLYHEKTSEEEKVKRIFKNILSNYPWSITVKEPMRLQRSF